MTQFADAFGAAGSVFDTAFGEPVQLIPQVGGGNSKYFRRGDDPNNPSQNIVGVFSSDTVTESVKGSGANTHENQDILTQRTTVDFDQALFTDPSTYPQQNWIIVATSQPRQPRYDIVNVEPDGISRVVCRIAFRDYAQP